MKNLTRNQWIAVAVAVVVIGFFFGLGNFLFPFIFNTSSTSNSNSTNLNNMPQNQNNDSLQVVDTVLGSGAQATIGSTITVNYVGTFLNGVKFDSSYDRGTPFDFTIGARQVIAGWEQGILGMKVGGKRHLVVPPSLAYGPNDYGPIPGNSTLVFDVELLAVK